ncbi:MAG: cyclopropane-fatty-acyl-phospholipid synthase [Lasallia pustulata]|uniref:Cyclopropane-fatty-acyl-phospholipid synthase n=1 Tax=Lasallia pustulata TaxID=136370 RepID=A0A5M8PKM2_9LECA|nr:MAG: cyclopropane-fatty-acyl-phospholipid synthase [Lasallia pustulata]
MWESWASLLKSLPFSETILAAFTDLARRIVLSQLHKLEHGTLIIHDTDGSKYVFGASATNGARRTASYGTEHPPEKGQLHKKLAPSTELHIHSPLAWPRLLAADLGFAEAYLLSELSCPSLPTFFRLFILNSTLTSSFNILSTLTTTLPNPFHRLSNTRSQALLNAQGHYSLSNAIFAAFLDPTMTYSAPLWLPLSDPGSATDTLEAAQVRKLRYTIAAARIKRGEHVLELGTGWGSFAIEAVRRTSCRVTTITASAEQAERARERVREAGFEDSVEVLVCDYRDVTLPRGEKGRFDKVVSIEMIEHVGAEYLDTYFGCVDRYLKVEGGIAVVQCTTMPEGRYQGYQGRKDFIQRYIFPGGHLPTVSGLVASIDRATKGSLVVEDIKSVSGHYVKALRLWRERFLGNWEEVIKPALTEKKPGMSGVEMDIFRRKWEYYFSYCEAGFVTKTLGDVSITVGREGAVELIDDVPR